MSSLKRTMKVYDSKGFHYDVDVKHYPHLGFSAAEYKGSVLGQVDEWRIATPLSDIENDWEYYEQEVSEWMDNAETDLMPVCKEYFDKIAA